MNATILTQSCRVRTATAAALLASMLAACSGGDRHGGFGGFPPAPVTLLQVKAETVPVRFEYVGQTAGSKEAEVRARVQGILERRTYQEGGVVKAGQTMFVIDPQPYAAQAEQAEAALAQAQAQLAQARRLVERLKPLVGDKAVSQREYDDAISAEETAAAGVKLAQARLTEARLNLSYTTVTAPVSGFASRAQKSEGSLVSPGADSLLATVSQIDPLYVNFSISENEKLRFDKLVAEGRLVLPDPKRGALEVTLRLADGSVFPRKGKLSFIDPRINPATGSFDARAEVANPDGALRPGQFVRVQLNGAARPNAIVVPQRAVMDGPQGKFVYVAAQSPEGKDIALPRPVTVGDWVEIDGANQWIVESGLQPGDQVVVEGMAKIFPIPTGAPIAVGAPPGADAAKGGTGQGGARKK
ncbi:MAG: efflux RND transporter periplasmic adaptor subunit [Burkholderiaceae bacterium]